MKKGLTFKLLSFALLGACAVSMGNGAISNANTIQTNDAVTTNKKIRKAEGTIDENAVDLAVADSSISCKLKDSTVTSLSQSYKFQFEADQFSSDKSYMLGYYGEGDDYRPLTFTFDVEDKNGVVTSRTSQLEKKNTNSQIFYDSIGPDFSYTFSNYADLLISRDYEVLPETIKISNIFGITEKWITTTDPNTGEDKGYWEFTPNYEESYFINPDVNFKNNFIQSDFFTTEFTYKTTFRGFTSLNVDLTSKAKEVYPDLYSKYEDYEDALADGSCYLNVQLVDVVDTNLVVELKDGSERAFDISTSDNIYLTEDVNGLSFLIADLDADDVESFYIDNLTYEMKLTEIDEDGIETDVSRSDEAIRFARVAFESDQEISVVNLNAEFIWTFVGLLVVIGAIDTYLYFYRKEKYKNDEFRRVNNRNYVVNSVIFWAGAEIFILDLLVIIARVTTLNNTIAIYNPLDAYIIWLTLFTLFFIGFVVKYIKGAAENNKERKKVERLGLNEKVDDDGTN